MNAPKRTHANRTPGGQIRIIGGKWRGRKLAVAPRPGLRPSPDRVRETVFNWIAPYISGARCLDLFAGTGALGFEALSRGAQWTTFLDNDPQAVQFLRRHAAALDAQSVDIIHNDALTWLRHIAPPPFDIVFLDPPFGQGYIETILDELQRGWLKHRAWVYLEAEKIPILDLAAAPWQLVREGHTRRINFALVEFNSPVAS